MSANVKLVREDPNGIMASIFSTFASKLNVNGTTDALPPPPIVMSRFGFILMLAECGLSGMASLPVDDLWQQGINLDRQEVKRLRSPYSYSGISFRVFPTMLSLLSSPILAEERRTAGDVVETVDRPDPVKEARANLMRKYLLPLYKRITAGAVKPHIPPMPAKVVDPDSVGDEPPSSETEENDAAVPAVVSEAPASPPASSTENTESTVHSNPAISSEVEVHPTGSAAAVESTDTVELTKQPGTDVNVLTSVVAAHESPNKELHETEAELTLDEEAYLTGQHAPSTTAATSEVINPLRPYTEGAAVAAEVQENDSVDDDADFKPTLAAQAPVPASHLPQYKPQYAQQPQQLHRHVIGDPQPRITRGRGVPAYQRNTVASERRTAKVTTQSASPPPPRVARSVSPQEAARMWTEFDARQNAFLQQRQTKLDRLREQMETRESGAVSPSRRRKPELSAGTKKILAENDYDRIRARSLARSLQKTAPPRVAEPAAANPTAATPVNHAFDAVRKRLEQSIAAGQALYQNAVNRAARHAMAIKEAEEEAARQAASRKTNTKSDEILRRRLSREVAAACVFAATSRSYDSADTSASAAAAADGDENVIGVVPWWLFRFTPHEVAATLHLTGFLAAPLSANVATSIAQHNIAEPTEEDLEKTTLLHLQTSIELFSHVWKAISFPYTTESEGKPATSESVPEIHSVVLLATLQALITGGYDVRIGMLELAAADIGLPHPYIAVGPPPAAALSNTTTAQAATLRRTIQSPMAEEHRGDGDGVDAPGVDGMPVAFAQAIRQHMSELRKLLAGSTTLRSEGEGADTEAAGDNDSSSNGNSMVPRAARDVLEGRVNWPISLLRPLKTLYANRLSHLGKLTKSDTSLDSASNAMEGRPLFAVNKDMRRAETEGIHNAELTFRPELNPRSLAMAAQHHDPSVPREVALIKRGEMARERARKRQLELSKSELAGCTFQPRLNKTRNVSNTNNNRNKDISRFELLYRQAQLKAQEKAIKAAAAAAEKEASETVGCTFRPHVNASPRARVAAHHLTQRLGDGEGALSGDETYRSHSLDHFAAELLPRVLDEVGSPGHTAARLQERSQRRSLLDELTQAAARGDMQLPAPANTRKNDVLYVMSPEFPRESPEVAETFKASNTAAAPPPKGVDTFLERMKRSQAEKETKRKLDEALEGGYLHAVKSAILDPASRDELELAPPPHAAAHHRRGSNSSSFVDVDTSHAALDSSAMTSAPPQSQSQQQQQQQASQVFVGYQLGPPPVVYVDVNVTPSITERIPLWEESNCQLVASSFAQKHGLTVKMMNKLAATLEAQRSAVLNAQRAF